MAGDCLAEKNKIMYKGKETDCVIQPLQGSKPHAFMMDCTHDNEAPNFKQTAESALALGALVSFCGSSVGSSKGFDDFYGKLLDVVGETRKYEQVKYDSESSIGAVKRVLNHLHTEMVQKGFAEGHLHQENDVGAIQLPSKVRWLIMPDSTSSRIVFTLERMKAFLLLPTALSTELAKIVVTVCPSLYSSE